MQGYDIDELYREAQSRWLKPVEILHILQNQDKYQLTQEAPQQPTSGSLFLFNKRVLRFFRKDGHNWRKKKDGRTVGEAHERLKVGNFEALNCYYAHGEQNPTFQRRIYWMLDPEYEHIVLVHYREINKEKLSFGSIPRLSPESSSIFSPTPGSYFTCNPGSTSFTIDYSEQYQPITSPESIEVSSKIALKNNGIDSLDSVSTTGELTSSSDMEVSQALRKLEEQLSLNEDSIKDIPFSIQNDDSYDSGVPEYERETLNHNDISNILNAPECTSNEFGDCSGMQNYSNNFVLFQNEGPLSAAGNGNHHHQPLGNEFTGGSKDSISWTDVLGSYNTSSGFELQDSFHGNNFQNSSMLMPKEVEKFSLPFSSRIESNDINTNSYPLFYDQGLTGMPLEGDMSLTVAQRPNFTIREISPEWAYTNEATKVIIIGSFLCDPSESVWKCMFGDIEVPVQIIQEGVIRCETPWHSPGKVNLCITSGNRESCSEVREFEYRVKTSNSIHSNVNQTESMKSTEELLLLVRFVQALLSDLSIQEGGSEGYSLRKLEADDDSWSRVIEALLDGSGSSSTTIDWLLEELVKDKLQQWLSSRSHEGDDQPTCSLSRKEQGIIHMVAGLGFEWALHPILSCRVSIDFRDINGWTALHWAARFGREKMVAALVASGASAGAVTDPNTKDPTGRTPASIAAFNGHKGLAGYLSEVALTSHLSSLRLEESELSKVSAEVEAEKTVNSISNGCLATNEDQVSLKNTLNAVRSSVQAAGRIQAAFRAHSFRKRQQRESGADIIDEYGISLGDIQGLSAMSKLGFGNAHNYNSAALSIQKKYRGWKGRKDFLALRQKVVKIQAHVRGYQARKHYNVICWAVGFMDKVVLRWRRKGSGLRGFLNEKEVIDDKEDEDILKVFRKQKVDGALEKALKRVLSMVRSPEARQQYHRMLERYHQAKAELGASSSEAEPTNDLGDFFDMENNDIFFQ